MQREMDIAVVNAVADAREQPRERPEKSRTPPPRAPKNDTGYVALRYIRFGAAAAPNNDMMTSMAQASPQVLGHAAHHTPAAARLVSLDAFRGLTIALMVLVNTGSGHMPVELRHSHWNGWTLADVVFPSFLWIAGISMTLSFARRVANGASRSALFRQVLRRAAILYAFGLFLYAFPDFNPHTFRILGVLQRIAICYAAAAAIYLTTGIRGQIAWLVGLLTAYWMLMTLVPVPGYGPGRLDIEGNLAHYIDSIVLGAHNYASTKTWDPEGIVSTIPAIATVLFGILAGHLIRLRGALAERTCWLFSIGAVLLALGIFCNTWLPINKSLWTSSFSIFMAGLDFVVFALALWLIDGQGWRRGLRPLAILGMNAITVYMCSEFFDEVLHWIPFAGGSLRLWLYTTLFTTWLPAEPASVLYALTYTAAMFAIAYAMYRRGWFLRV